MPLVQVPHVVGQDQFGVQAAGAAARVAEQLAFVPPFVPPQIQLVAHPAKAGKGGVVVAVPAEQYVSLPNEVAVDA